MIKLVTIIKELLDFDEKSNVNADPTESFDW